MKKCITLVDSTLRDGAQSPGVWFTLPVQRRILRALVRVGITEVEAGIPAASKYHQQEFRALLQEFPSLTLIAWNRLRKDDVIASLKTGCTVVHLSAPTSDVMRETKLGWSRSQLFQKAADLIHWCLDNGLTVYVGAEDASRTEESFLIEYFCRTAEWGAKRFRYADTVGCEYPTKVRERLGRICRYVPFPVEYHGHNDMGLATANSLAAVEGGCTAVSVTVNGLGERAGNASLAEVAVALKLCLGKETGIDFSHLAVVSRLVAYVSHRPLGPDRPLVGSCAFTHESGIHVDGILKNPLLYTAVPPELVGRSHRFVAGRNSGTSAIRFLAQQEEYDFSERELEKILTLLKNPRILPHLRGRPERFQEILRRVRSNE
ncbi:MAG: hypothetical protein N2Z76_00280 [Treponemataceae bacterium]|nr:hypothetical protein [Treponemataceae bacterium]